MRRPSRAARVAALAAVCVVGVPVAITTASAVADVQSTTALAGSVAAVAASNPGVGAVSGTESETIEVWMAGHEQAAQRFADAVSTPGSPTYHEYLSPTAYTQRFGPSAAQVKAVGSYLAGVGFTRVQASVNDDYVSATARVSRINRAFSVQMRRYDVTDAEGRSTTFESNDRGLTVPAWISGDILAVTGVNTTQPVDDATTGAGAGGATSSTAASSAAKAAACSNYWAQKTTTFSPAFDGLTQAAVPVCGYSAKQIRAAYGLSSADTGTGKTIAVIEAGTPNTMLQALTGYAKGEGLPAPHRGQYRSETIGHGRCIDYDDTEAILDSEAAYATAPGADQLMVNGCDTGNNLEQALFDAELAPLTGHRSRASAAIESVCYEFGGERSEPPSLLKTSRAIALRAAAEGVSLLFDSGDSPGVESPADDPEVTAVGGTTLGIGAHDQRLFETGWSTLFGVRTGTSGPWRDQGAHEGAGGGASVIYGEPSYQKGVVPSALAENSKGRPGRAVPDISADGDFYSAMRTRWVFTNSKGKTSRSWESQGGTSLATPLVAGIVADAEQGQRKNLGFLNPLLYSLAGSAVFHDILSLSPSDPQVDRAFYTPDVNYINHKYAEGYRVGVTNAQDVSGTHQVTAPGLRHDDRTGHPERPGVHQRAAIAQIATRCAAAVLDTSKQRSRARAGLTPSPPGPAPLTTTAAASRVANLVGEAGRPRVLARSEEDFQARLARSGSDNAGTDARAVGARGPRKQGDDRPARRRRGALAIVYWIEIGPDAPLRPATHHSQFDTCSTENPGAPRLLHHACNCLSVDQITPARTAGLRGETLGRQAAAITSASSDVGEHQVYADVGEASWRAPADAARGAGDLPSFAPDRLSRPRPALRACT
jgi:hypothetical protein